MSNDDNLHAIFNRRRRRVYLEWFFYTLAVVFASVFALAVGAGLGVVAVGKACLS